MDELTEKPADYGDKILVLASAICVELRVVWKSSSAVVVRQVVFAAAKSFFLEEIRQN